MKLIFTDQYANIFLLVNGLALLFYYAAKKKKRQRAMTFGNYKTLQKVAGKNFLKSSNILLVMKMAALTSLVIGISNPVIVKEVASTNTDYVIALDSSASMLASDMDPTRFDAAKEISKTFVDQTSNDTNVGVVSFAGSVKKNSELEANKELIKSRIEGVQTGTKAGTAIGDAIYSSTTMLLDSNKSKKIILITDGRNNVGVDLNKSIDFATENKVTVNAIGIGETNRSNQKFGIVDGQNASQAAYPNLDSEGLYNLTNSTGGELITVSNTTGLKNAFLTMEKTKVRDDVSRPFILLAVIIMLSEWVLGTTKYSILP